MQRLYQNEWKNILKDWNKTTTNSSSREISKDTPIICLIVADTNNGIIDEENFPEEINMDIKMTFVLYWREI